MVRFVIMNMYDSCGYSNYSNNQNIQIPSEFTRMIHNLIDPLDLSTKGTREIFDFMVYLTGNLLNEFSNSQSDSIGREISMLQAGLISTVSQVKGQVPSIIDPVQLKFIHAMAGIVAKAKAYVTKHRYGKFVVNDTDIEFAYKVIIPGGFKPLIELDPTPVNIVREGAYDVFKDGATTYAVSYIDNEPVLRGIMVNGVVNKPSMKEEHDITMKFRILPSYKPYIKSVFEKYGLPITEMQAIRISSYANLLLYDMPTIANVRKMSRVAFFSANMKPVDIDVRDVEKIEILEEAPIERYGDVEIEDMGIGEEIYDKEKESKKAKREQEIMLAKYNKGPMPTEEDEEEGGDEDEGEVMDTYDEDEEDKGY